MNRFILWDIDGTLIYSGGVAGEVMRKSMERVYGSYPVAERHAYAGKTDQQIIMEAFPAHAAEAVLDTLEQFSAVYTETFLDNRELFLARAQVLDGVVPALERLAALGAVQSVLTGNIRPIARLKLELLGIAQFFDFEAGAYGSDHHRRIELVPIALRRAEARYGRSFVCSDAVVIGDTPNDIACGRAGGTRTVAVATGPFSVAQLAEHAPDATLPDLADTEAVLAAVLGTPAGSSAL